MQRIRSTFESSRWGVPDSAPLLTIGLILATVVWIILYLWLGWRLLNEPSPIWRAGNLILAALCVLLGVGIALGWIVVLPRWRAWGRERFRRVEWPALSVAEVQALTPSEFESYVAYRLFERQGYTVENRRDVKDGGVDISVVSAMGRHYIVQCKRYNSTVGSSTVRDLYGTMIHEGAIHAYLVTSGPISRDAREWGEGKPITFIDGEELAKRARVSPMLDSQLATVVDNSELPQQ